MFKDYYKILGIHCSATDEEIKRAYRTMSMKWHPDMNPDADVTSMMQDINEAYAILKNKEKRHRYDQEYALFCTNFTTEKHRKEDCHKTNKAQENEWSYEYDIRDDNLKNDIKNAREYARSLVEEFLKSFKKSSVAAVKGAASNVTSYAIGWVFAGIALSLIGFLIKSCN